METKKNKKIQSPFMGKTKKEYTDITTLSADVIIPINQEKRIVFWEKGICQTDMSQTISRFGCFPIDSIYESMREGFKHFTHFICDFDDFLICLEDEKLFELHGKKHPSNLSYNEMFERYPNNFWTVDLDNTHLYQKHGREKDDDKVVFCNVDYPTVKITSEIIGVGDVQVPPFLENLKYRDGFQVERDHPDYLLHTSSPILFPHSSHCLDRMSPN